MSSLSPVSSVTFSTQDIAQQQQQMNTKMEQQCASSSMQEVDQGQKDEEQLHEWLVQNGVLVS